MADNTRKTSNIIHDLDKVKDDVSNNSQNIQNNTESIGDIKVYDSHIWLSTSKGLTVTQDGNTTTNNDQPTEWKLEADTNYLNTTLNFAKSDEIPSVYVKDIKSGDITTLTVAEEDGVYTLTATGGGGGGGIDNITLAEGTCIKIDSEPYDDNGTTKTRLTINTDTDCLNTTLDFAKPTDIGDGNITLKSTDNTVSITGANATANQATDTAWDLSVNIPTTATPGDGKIDLSGGTGIDVSGTNATANQTGNTAWSVAVDSTVALKSDIPVIPSPVVPGDGELKLTGGTGIDVTGANGTANQTSDSNQTISIDSTVALKSDIPTIPPAVVPGDGNITLTEGDGITVSGADATANQTSDTAWTVETDNDYLNANLNFAKPGDIPTDLGVLTIENITPHANGDFDFVSSDDALVVNPTPHGLSLSIDEDELEFVKGIITGNPATLTVSEADGVYTLTAIGGGSSGGGGGILVASGDGIKVDSEIVDIGGEDYTQYTIKADKTWLEDNLDFATNQDLADAIGNITIPEKTSDLVNDGEGTDPFITAADLPDPPTVPTKTSDLLNDGNGEGSQFATVEEVEEEVAAGIGTLNMNLPISSEDGTVVLDSPSANTFTVSTGGSERFAVASGGQLLVGETTLENANFNVHVRGEDNVQICIDATDEDATTGAVLKLRTGDDKYWNFQHSKTVDGSPENNQLIISNGSGTFMRGYQDNSAAFGNNVIVSGQVQTDKITSKSGSINDALIQLGANIIAGAGTGGSFIIQTNNTGKFFIDSNGYATFKPLNVERVVVDGEGLKVKQLKGADDAYGKDVSRIQLRNTDDNDSALTIVSYGSGIDELQTFSGVGPNGVGVIGRTDHPFAIGTEFNQPLYLSSNNLKQVEITNDDVTFTNNIKTSSVSGLNDNDALIQLGADCQILVGATQSYGLRVRSDGNVAVGGVGGGTSRFSVQGTVSGDDVYGANIIPDFNHNVTISTANAIQVNPKFSSDVTQAFLYTNAKLTTTDKVGKLTAFNYTIDYNDPTAKEATSENRAFATNLRKAEGKDNWAIIASGTAPSFFAGDVRNPAGSNPENDDSLVTKGWVQGLVGNGNRPDEDTVPGTGSGFRWQTKIISEATKENGQSISDYQLYGVLYAYDGIFTDGLHWTRDGYQWYTSDTSARAAPFLETSASRDNGKVIKGVGNEYMTAGHYSNDMVSWRATIGVSSGASGFQFLDGDFYHDGGMEKYDRITNIWTAAPIWKLADGSSRQRWTDTASQESGDCCLGVTGAVASADLREVLWTHKDNFGVLNEVLGIDSPISCLFSERLQKWLVITDEKFHITDIADLRSATWTAGDLPTPGNWNRIIDDGATISLFNTADNANVILYCNTASGPSVTSDWQVTTNIDNRGYTGACGTNGRSIVSRYDDVRPVDSDTTYRDYYYAISGDIRLDPNTDTSQINLTNPEDPNFFTAVEREAGRKSTAPKALLTTQEDANGYFAEEIAENAGLASDAMNLAGAALVAAQSKTTVIVLSQDEYDGLSPPDPETLYLIS